MDREGKLLECRVEGFRFKKRGTHWGAAGEGYDSRIYGNGHMVPGSTKTDPLVL